MSVLSTAPSERAVIEQLGKDARMQIHSLSPTNLETPLDLLNAAITPAERFFMRNNHPIPSIARSAWSLAITGHVDRPFTISYAELRELPAVRMLAFLECYGNGRRRFAEQGQLAEGVPWYSGAIANAEWVGVPVSVLLERAGVRSGAIQAECQGGGKHSFVRGVEVAKLLDDAMLAYAMNGQDLPKVHGGPVRLIVPGWGGINWVKWIVSMTLLDHESPSPYNQQSYVLIDQDGTIQGKAREVRVKSVIVNPRSADTLAAGSQVIQGMAWSPHGVAQVDISTDGGVRWQPAKLLEDMGPRAWRQFRWHWEAAAGNYQLAARATDLAGNVQPVEVPFNQKGYLMNAIEFVSAVVA